MTEEIPAAPGWVEERLDQLFAGLPAKTKAARDNYARCVAGRKAPAAPSDLLGAEFETCRATLSRDLLSAGLDRPAIERLSQALEALEAEIGQDS